MKLPVARPDQINVPNRNFAYAFIDSEDKKLKIKKHDGLIEFTNELNDIQLLNLCDYTAFEVFAHNYDITTGECEELGGFVNEEIPANMTHMFTLRTMVQNYTKSDVIIDWGDGSFSSIANQEFEPIGNNLYGDSSASTEEGEANYTFKHTYKEPGKYIVKIYGHDYYNINAYSKVSWTSEYLESNLICRIFDHDLPLACHYKNLSQMCAHADRLLYVNAEIIKYNYFVNISNLFSCSHNLLEAVGFKRNFTVSCCSQVFIDCWNLKKTDMQVATESVYVSGPSKQYCGCSKLEIDIAKLLPEVTPKGGTINVSQLFYNCEKLTGIVPADKLWDNKQVTWLDTSQAFEGCSDKIREQVPVSWGGTKIDNITE
jgi:hypothetical protein